MVKSRYLNKGIFMKRFYVFLLVLFASCNRERFPIKPIDNIVKPSGWFLVGILPNPYQGVSFDSIYKYASSFTHIVPVWGRPSPFYKMPEDLSGWWGDYFVKSLIRANNMVPLIHFNFYGEDIVLISPPEISNPTLANSQWRKAYQEAILDVLIEIKPKYISIGNEVNKWLEKYGYDGDNGFNNWVTLYEEIYDTIKKLSPDSKIFCTFAREIVKENREADLSFLSHFDPNKIDIIVFTSYPYSVNTINSPTDIPQDYYSKVLNYLNKPVGFSEISWPSRPQLGGEAGESLFIHLIPELISNMEIEFVMWPWLCDLDPNDYTGLKRYDGTEKPGFREWKNLYRND